MNTSQNHGKMPADLRRVRTVFGLTVLLSAISNVGLLIRRSLVRAQVGEPENQPLSPPSVGFFAPVVWHDLWHAKDGAPNYLYRRGAPLVLAGLGIQLGLAGCSVHESRPDSGIWRSAVPYVKHLQSDRHECGERIACAYFDGNSWVIYYTPGLQDRSVRHEIEFHIQCKGSHDKWVDLPDGSGYAKILWVAPEPGCEKYVIGQYIWVWGDGRPDQVVASPINQRAAAQ